MRQEARYITFVLSVLALLTACGKNGKASLGYKLIDFCDGHYAFEVPDNYQSCRAYDQCLLVAGVPRWFIGIPLYPFGLVFLKNVAVEIRLSSISIHSDKDEIDEFQDNFFGDTPPSITSQQSVIANGMIFDKTVINGTDSENRPAVGIVMIGRDKDSPSPGNRLVIWLGPSDPKQFLELGKIGTSIRRNSHG